MKKSATPIKTKYTSGKPGHVEATEYFYYDTAPDYNQDFAIVCGGYEKCAADFDINRNDYPYYFVIYTISGKGTLETNSQTLPLEAGVLTGFEPGVPHHYKSDPENPMEHIFVTFIGKQASDLLAKSVPGQQHYCHGANPEITHSRFQHILDIGLQKGTHSQELCCHYLHIALLEIASSVNNTTTHIPLSRQSFEKCKNYIDVNFSVIQSPGQVAYQCDIDVRYMSSLFKRYWHVSPSQYIMRLKLNKAANLLLTTDEKIKDIAEEIGFENQYHFSKNFKQFHGRSPKHYRQTYQQQ